jgi:hypothetical protein
VNGGFRGISGSGKDFAPSPYGGFNLRSGPLRTCPRPRPICVYLKILPAPVEDLGTTCMGGLQIDALRLCSHRAAIAYEPAILQTQAGDHRD